MRLRGKGAPKRAGGHGDQFVKLKVMLPREAGPELEAFVSGWENGKTYNPARRWRHDVTTLRELTTAA